MFLVCYNFFLTNKHHESYAPTAIVLGLKEISFVPKPIKVFFLFRLNSGIRLQVAKPIFQN